ncbi:SH3 domain-containing protein [Jannaschia sp. M317]|uniref:SH3 domain-containing protein n=1 Tax=Jannaschia sp. M317 TaxID=2867011 RepID=UPI0021A7CB0D|nr:SH3 domain-containing protein [Jannaschia sp. M317]UWQ17365.1 SH3 domain-containing protein [Jannaschia sp. M317]
MLKMTFTLTAALYVGFVVWGDPTSASIEAAERDAPVIVNAAADFDRPVILQNGSAPEAAVTRTAVPAVQVPDPAVIAASAPAPTSVQPRLIGEPVVVSLVQPAAPVETVVTPPEADRDLLQVTGSRVNMRSGPSTSNGVVASLSEGTLAEPLGEPINGWQEIREVETGRTGFMASRFLAPS